MFKVNNKDTRTMSMAWLSGFDVMATMCLMS